MMKVKLYIAALLFASLSSALLSTNSFAASAYDDIVSKTTTSTLINHIDNYYGKSCGSASDDYAERWLYEFKRQNYSHLSYHPAAVASLQTAISSPDGAYAVTYEQKNNHDNTSNPYLATVYWTEHDKASFETTFGGTAPNRYLKIGRKTGSSAQLYSAVIVSSHLVRNGGLCRPEFLWGYEGYEVASVSFSESSHRKLYVSTFDTSYPPGYEGDTISSADPALTWQPNYDDLLEKITTEKIVNKIDNYYGKNCGSLASDYSSSWLTAFKRQSHYRRTYHPAAVASLERAMAHGAYAIEYTQRNNGNNTSEAYFITIYWTEDKSQFKAKFRDEPPSRYFTIERPAGSSAMLHTAVVASPHLVQGGGTCDAVFLWGYEGYEAARLTFKETGNTKLFKSTFDIEYPDDYQGAAVPGDKASIKYLALGDSFSSGEGDTEKNKAINQKYYMQGTNEDGDSSKGIPREKCHVSTRSYPHYLVSAMALGKGESRQWGTVACSGAVVYDVNQHNKAGYEGQWSGKGDPGVGRLHGLSNKAELQQAALNEMIPGRKKQVEFVEKYKPKAITLTMGGNDVGFSNKIQSCAIWTNTCQWVDSDKPILGSSIRHQFDNLVNLYTELKNAGDSGMRIYAIGYPQFITDVEPAACENNAGFVDREEREMIAQATGYMNEVIEAAAHKVGVKYVDITDALNGGKLCEEGQKYVTGIVGFGDQESYHPNDYGHIKIAQKIKEELNNESLLAYSQYPSSGDSNVVAPLSPYFDNGPASAINTTMIADNNPTKGSTHTVSVLPYTLKPNSIARVEVHSDPVDLGDFTVDSDGSLSGSITIPSNLPVGHHTLHITGQSYSDESIVITQTILVTGSDGNDLDDNGTPDSQQPCGAFLQASGQDDDFDGVDDACDPQITEPILYAARNGITSLGEDPDKLYLFRNVRVSSITGITGDYVNTSTNPNNKEALVASSQGIQTEGVFNKFVMLQDENDPNTKIPTILMKDASDTCTALQPTDYLSPALSPTHPNYQPRGFIQLTQLPGGIDCE